MCYVASTFTRSSGYKGLFCILGTWFLPFCNLMWRLERRRSDLKQRFPFILIWFVIRILSYRYFSRASQFSFVRLAFWVWFFQIISFLRPSVWTVFSPLSCLFYYSALPILRPYEGTGFPIAISLDNGLSGEADHLSVEINSLFVHSGLFKSGFVPYLDKSQWEPAQTYVVTRFIFLVIYIAVSWEYHSWFRYPAVCHFCFDFRRYNILSLYG